MAGTCLPTIVRQQLCHQSRSPQSTPERVPSRSARGRPHPARFSFQLVSETLRETRAHMWTDVPSVSAPSVSFVCVHVPTGLTRSQRWPCPHPVLRRPPRESQGRSLPRWRPSAVDKGPYQVTPCCAPPPTLNCSPHLPVHWCLLRLYPTAHLPFKVKFCDDSGPSASSKCLSSYHFLWGCS